MSEFTPKSERLGRLITNAPKMYELLKNVFELWNTGAIIDGTETIESAKDLLARIDSEEAQE